MRVKKPFTIVFHRFPEQLPKHGSKIFMLTENDGSGVSRLATVSAKVEILWEHESNGDSVPSSNSKLYTDERMRAEGYVKMLNLDFGENSETRSLDDKPFLWNYFSEINKVATRAKI